MQQSILDFFDLNKPCPEDIKDCIDLRKQYEQDVQSVSNGGGCSKCAINRIKSKFINIIISNNNGT